MKAWKRPSVFWRFLSGLLKKFNGLRKSILGKDGRKIGRNSAEGLKLVIPGCAFGQGMNGDPGAGVVVVVVVAVLVMGGRTAWLRLSEVWVWKFVESLGGRTLLDPRGWND